MFNIELTKKALKQLNKLDESLRVSYVKFFREISLNPFVGKLDDITYHAHVKYRWVAVWEVDKTTKIVKITFVGSREDAPYGK